jgi:integrase
LQAGREPQPAQPDGVTLGQALYQFLGFKKRRASLSELSERSYQEYDAVCERIRDSIGKHRLLSDIQESDLEQLREDLKKGKRGPLGVTSHKGNLNRARIVFRYINEKVAEKTIHYRTALCSPPQKQLRAIRNKRKRRFERSEIKAMLDNAPRQLKAMILLAINCGFGNRDCASLPIDALNLDDGWHEYARPKTEVERRAVVAETVAVIRDVLAKRRKDLPEEVAGLVVTRYRQPWLSEGSLGDCPISYEFRKQLKSIGIYRANMTTFYALRRTFATIAARTPDQVAVNYITGHAASNSDMPAVYRTEVSDENLLAVSNYVRDWLFKDISEPANRPAESPACADAVPAEQGSAA